MARISDIRDVWDFENPAESERRFQELFENSSGEDNDFRALILTQKARAQGMQRRFDDARLTLQAAHSLLPEGNTEGWAAYWIELGRVENSSGNPKLASPYFVKSLEIAKVIGNEFLAIDAAHMLGISEEGTAALHWDEIAIDMATMAKEPKARDWLGSLLNNAGWAYYELGQYDNAMHLFERALEFRESKRQKKPILIAQYSIAKCLRALGRLDDALRIQRELEMEFDKIGGQDGYVYEEIAECLLALGRPEEAMPYFGMAYEKLCQDEWLMAQEPARVERLKSLAM